MHDDFRAAFTRTGCGRVARAVVDYENVIELRAGPLGHPRGHALPRDKAGMTARTLLRSSGRPGSRARGAEGPSPATVLADDRMKIRRVIGAADERTGGDVSKTFSARDVTVEIELFRGDVARRPADVSALDGDTGLTSTPGSRLRADRPSFGKVPAPFRLGQA